MSDALLSTLQLAVGYDGDAVVSNVEFQLRAGDIVCLIGPNGAGKSTVLKTIARQLDAVDGTVFVDGRSLQDISQVELARNLSVLLTDRVSTELLTCQEIVEAGRYPHTGRMGILGDEDHARIRQAMELTRIWDLRDRDFMQVSDGQRQRVLLARAICQDPRVLILDEPSNYLDIRYQIEMLNVLRQLAGRGDMAIITSMHDLSLARKVATKVLAISEGGVFAQGTVEEVFTCKCIDALYGLVPGSYDPVTGQIDLDAALSKGDNDDRA